MFEDILVKNGFTRKEASVYLAVLECGQANMSMIVRKTKLERSTVYDLVARLEARRYLSVLQLKGVKQVVATPPNIIVASLKNSVKEVENILPDLMDVAFHSVVKPKIKFHDGLEGVKQVLREFSYTHEDTYVFTDYSTMPPGLPEFIWAEIVPERIRHNSFAHLLVMDSPVNRNVQKNDFKRLHEHRLVKFPLDLIPQSLEVLLWENKIGLLSFAKNEIFGMIIESKTITQKLINIHQLIWRNVDKLNSK